SCIDQGDQATAKKLAQRMYNEFLGMHDPYRDWITHLLSFIGARFGDDALHDALKETVGGYTGRLAERYSGKPLGRKVEMLLAGFRGHLHPFDIEEDDEKFTITPRPCGSGERLIREGAYASPRNFLKIASAQAMTFDRAEFPVYCAHCYFQNIIPVEEDGSPLFVTEPAEKLGEEPCRIYVYKPRQPYG
ncbi:MAG: hypothetical protein FJY85_21295, partial [Deltaproteobacteria bacterium]|nr:hypothetical protein [Deltaproteobacteria bacterium]